MRSALALLALAGTAQAADTDCDMIPKLYFNASVIRTVDEPRIAEAFCVTGDRFTAVGTLASVEKSCPGATPVNLNGAAVIPGLIDSHGHLLSMGYKLARPQFDNCTSADGPTNSVISVIKDYLKTHPLKPGQWLQGGGWDQNKWADKVFPTKEVLDKILPDNPVFLQRIDGHSGWANSAAIRTVPPLVQPEGGEIVRDKDGNPTGIFKDNAMNLIEDFIPEASMEETDEALKLVLGECARNGLTAMHNPGIDPRQVEIFKRTIDAGNMTVRQYGMWLGVSNDLGKAVPPTTPKIDDYGRGLLNVKAVKYFMDGALGSWGAAMLEPYSDRPNEMGYLRMTAEEFNRNVTGWVENGYQVATHAIGDRANRIVLDTYRNICTANGTRADAVPDLRLRIEHFQHVDLKDIARLHIEGGGKHATSCILPSMQPTHAVGDMTFAQTRVGPERIKGSYAWEKVLATGVKALAFGSDFPTVGTVPPLLGIYAAVTRQSTDGMPKGGWRPQDRVSSEQALRGYTIESAYGAFQEDVLGSITPGKYADFVALDKDIVTTDPADIWKATVVGTYVGGREVYRHDCWKDLNCPMVSPYQRIQWGGDGCPHGRIRRKHGHGMRVVPPKDGYMV